MRVPDPMRGLVVAILLVGIVVGTANGNFAESGRQNSTTQNTRSQHETGKARFLASLPPGFQVPPESDVVGTRLLAFYGAVFVARGGAVPPPVLAFADEDAVTKWQVSLTTDKTNIKGSTVELQSVALSAFVAARTEAQAAKLDITPRGTDPAKRNYLETIKWWESRVEPGLNHWVAAGRLPVKESRRIKDLSLAEQVPEILRLEERGLFFGGSFSRTILSSVAPPGASQHISMLATDINEYDSATVRAILAKHGWYQTVLLDTPHFTFLGVSEAELPSLGLRKVNLAGQDYWIPDLGISVDKLLDRRPRTVPTGGNN
jgi:hypothetical protein